MKALQKNKIMIMTIALFIIVIMAYNQFFKPESSEGDLTSSANIGSDIVELNSTLETVTLDKESLSSPAYKALVDYSAEIVNQPTGRLNPFGLVGGSKSGNLSKQSNNTQ